MVNTRAKSLKYNLLSNESKYGKKLGATLKTLNNEVALSLLMTSWKTIHLDEVKGILRKSNRMFSMCPLCTYMISAHNECTASQMLARLLVSLIN